MSIPSSAAKCWFETAITDCYHSLVAANVRTPYRYYCSERNVGRTITGKLGAMDSRRFALDAHRNAESKPSTAECSIERSFRL